jgi:hypothetical protein
MTLGYCNSRMPAVFVKSLSLYEHSLLMIGRMTDFVFTRLNKRSKH